MRQNIVAITTIVIFLAAGLYCFFGASRMQRRAIEASDSTNTRLFRGFIRSKSYLITARVAGVLCIVVAAFILLILLRS